MDMDDLNCTLTFNRQIDSENAQQLADFKQISCDIVLAMLKNMGEHCNNLINKKYKHSSSGGEEYHDMILDGDAGLVISDSDSDAAVNEDTKF